MTRAILALLLLATAASAQTYRIRVTDPDGNVSTSTIAASNRVALVSAWLNDGSVALGTNLAERLAARLEAHALTTAREHRVATVRARVQAEVAAAISASEAE